LIQLSNQGNVKAVYLVEYVEKFSATCLLFGEKMSEVFLDNLNIGLIDASYADTAIESWISDRVLSFCNTPENEKYFLMVFYKSSFEKSALGVNI